jgi:sulfate adenylyltransferase subunit 1
MNDHNNSIQLLRFTTAGSVDDGKSTLIGRLLFDSKAIFEDQLEAVKRSSEKKGLTTIDLSLLTDGLKDEREQGITIDVAYRYFSTPRRKFIIADTPGHIQYTRNMVTGASTANLALVLVDARKGIAEQTRRHAFIASLLQIPHLVLCVNKMDLMDYKEEVYNAIVDEFTKFSAKLSVKDIRFVPISALHGDNIVKRSANMPWYEGSTLLNMLETIHIGGDHNHVDCRFAVQTVIRPKDDQFHDFRGYAGRISGGVFKVGDEVIVLPSGFTTKIKTLEVAGEKLEEAFAPMSIVMTLEDEIDISRGDMIARIGNQPKNSQDIDAMVCWLNVTPFKEGTKYIIRQTSNEAKALVKNVQYKMNINTLHRDENNVKEIGMNDIVRMQLRITKPLLFDSYGRNRQTGSFILVEEGTSETVAAGMII